MRCTEQDAVCFREETLAEAVFDDLGRVRILAHDAHARAELSAGALLFGVALPAAGAILGVIAC